MTITISYKREPCELFLSYSQLLASVAAVGGSFVPLFDVHEFSDEYEVQTALMELNSYVCRYLPTLNSSKGFPDGNWYMVTVTTPASSTEAHCIETHEKAMRYFESVHIEVYYAVLEKSNIYHVHYVVNITTGNNKNTNRDLSKACNGYRCQVEKKANTLMKWNGMCKYVMKRGYDAEKKSTQIRTLVERIKYTEGHGYSLDHST